MRVTPRRPVELRDGVELSNLDAELFDGAGVTKRELVDYLDAAAEVLLPELADRPLSVIRARPGEPPFMQKNLPRYAPDWIPRIPVWSYAARREVVYALCEDRRTLLWFGNQRAVEFHPALLAGRQAAVTHLVLDLDPPDDTKDWLPGTPIVQTAFLVRHALRGAGLEGWLKTSGAKGLHIVVPVAADVAVEDAAAATRALAQRAALLDPSVATTAFVRADREGKVFVDATRSGGATVIAAFSPRARPGVPVSMPISWDALGEVSANDFTLRSVPAMLDDLPPRSAPQQLPADLIAEGHTIPVARVQAMHEGKRRKRAEQVGRETGRPSGAGDGTVPPH